MSDNICFLVAQYTVLFSVTLPIVRDGCSMKIDHVIIRVIGQGIIVNSERIIVTGNLYVCNHKLLYFLMYV